MASSLPDYVASAQPVPQSNRIAWFKSTAQTYASIMLWFVFWDSVPVGGGTPGGTLTHGVGIALGALVVAALLCHFLYYMVPGLLGQKTGLPLYIVGTSTYGTMGGLLMPGFLMGLLQFGWLGVNAFGTAKLLYGPFYSGDPDLIIDAIPYKIIAGLFAIAAAFVGLKGIRYIAQVATYLPLIPLAILIILVFLTCGGLASFDPQASVDATVAAAKTAGKEVATPLGQWEVIGMVLTSVIGFFATAGAAGTDIAMNNRHGRDVQLGGLVGIAGSTIFAGGLSLLIVAGAHGLKLGDASVVKTTDLMPAIVNLKTAAVFNYLLAIAAFPGACFSAFIAANSFKTTLPKVNPFISVGIGTAVSILLAVTGVAGKVVDVFVVIGASFGPICGAMAADYLLAGKRWAGPRAGFNLAGWLSWAVGLFVGSADLLGKYIPSLASLKGVIPVPPLAALVVGFVLYLVFAKLGLQSRVLEMPAAEQQTA